MRCRVILSDTIASGSKVTAIGGMIACIATGATPYYVRAERYAAETDGDVAEGIREVTQLPTCSGRSGIWWTSGLIVIIVGLFRIDRTTACGRTGKSLQ
ncbi:hypothetical protein BRC64_06585 [Halobacteriales archaeon QH_10_67_22]|nr:MAG: hypothetical protein BRC64_06585 [Halobacteriales archaeon QH_10_67_22]